MRYAPAMLDDDIAKIDAMIERIAVGRRHVQAIIEKQQRRLAANAEVNKRARELLLRDRRA